MEEPKQPEQPSFGPRGLLSIGAIVIAAIWIILVINSPLGWLAKVGNILAATTLAWLVPGLFGIEMINAFVPLAFLTVPIEGLILGGKLYGWPGAVAGLVIGLVLGGLKEGKRPRILVSPTLEPQERWRCVRPLR